MDTGVNGKLVEGKGLRAEGVEAPSPRPITPRVLANAAWGASRVLMKCWSQLQGAAPIEDLVYGQRRATDRATALGSPLRHRALKALGFLLAHIPATAPSFEPQHVSNLLYTLSRLVDVMPEALEAAAEATASNDSRNCSRGGATHSTAVGAVSRGIAPPGGPVVASAGAYSVKEVVAQRLARELLDASQLKLQSFEPQVECLGSSGAAVVLFRYVLGMRVDVSHGVFIRKCVGNGGQGNYTCHTHIYACIHNYIYHTHMRDRVRS